MNHPHRSPSCQPCYLAPAPGSALDEALKAIRARLGFAPKRLYETHGRPIRFGPDKSKRSKKPGWAYVYHGNGTWLVVYGDWRDYPVRYTWFSRSQHGLTDAELRRHNEEICRRLEQERLKQEGRQAAVARSVQAQWEALPPAPADHPYLVRKGVRPHGIRIKDGSLVVPLRDIAGQLWSWQTIDPEGRKLFHRGGRTKGLFFTFAQPGQLEAANTILICEGWATGATLHETLALPVVAAMNAGNLLPAASALREKFPEVKLVICADDDWETPGNPGVTKAQEAACCVGAEVAIPVWAGARKDGETDFNDLALAEGCEAVRRIVEAVLAAPESRTDSAPAPDETTSSAPDVPSPGVPDEGKGKAPGQSPRPGKDERPCFWLLEEPTEILDGEGSRQYKPGVYYCWGKPKEVSGQRIMAPVETWLASPIRLVARTTQWPDGAQGVRLNVYDGDGWRDVVLPREALASRRHREILLACGASLEAQSRDAMAWLVEYLQQSPSRREWTTERTGWHGEQYVLPDTTVGEGTAISFIGLRPTDEPLTAGELAEWQRSVAALAVGNPLLAFSISLPFAGPLLKLTGYNSVLVHLVGRSTTGKTTCLMVANSVVGPPALVATWRATADGLEQKALVHCDGFLALDEIGQAEPRVLDHAIYALVNGAAKQRARVYEHGVGAAPTQRWRLAVLSSGERTVETLLAMGGCSINAGQAVRLIEIPVAERYGAFTELHGCESGATFADTLRRATSRYYGTPIRAFLEKLCNDDRDALNQVLDGCRAKLLEAVKNSDAAPGAQASRVLASMALAAAAGELATSYGITGWEQGEAIRAALCCYRLWARRRAVGTDLETVTLIRQVYDFITRYGDSRFTPVDDGVPGGEARNNPVVYNRAGYYRDRDGDREYLFTPDGFREATHGFDFWRARQELLRLGVLIPGKDRDSQSVRIGFGSGRVRVYVVSFGALNNALEQVGE